MSNTRKKLGAKGEELVAKYLAEQGWRILATNVHTRHGELDIVARLGRRLAIVEVKTRRSQSAGLATESFTHKKFVKLRHSTWEAQQGGVIPKGPVEFALAAVSIRGQKASIQVFWNLGPSSLR